MNDLIKLLMYIGYFVIGMLGLLIFVGIVNFFLTAG